ncbi:hypothetical protein [Pseudomonas vancouverensis]|uniref:Uncharacterized protein n=1 Tax=Pseudomonas vancouverensis TaxID=95300 RepID=A0A4R4JY58_PSEVA|nr:hypothetical protein [Pseudomonas vancouverensis]KAB0499151.1 hypothetical protein F7R09_07595 [Pseudomonas vancouverensis]TDB59867.1 hypothetical protein EIY72_18190 [Pseudomonas vancouverensis]
MDWRISPDLGSLLQDFLTEVVPYVEIDEALLVLLTRVIFAGKEFLHLMSKLDTLDCLRTGCTGLGRIHRDIWIVILVFEVVVVNHHRQNFRRHRLEVPALLRRGPKPVTSPSASIFLNPELSDS